VNVFGEEGGAQKPAGKREAQKEETRARILQVARSHFERDGFDGTSVRAIASDAGVAAGTVLLHFIDKRDLLHAALFVDLAAVIDEALRAPTGAEADDKRSLELRLGALARPFFAYYATRPKLSKTLLREALLAESPWRERFTAQVTRVHVHIVRLVEAAKGRGELVADADGPVLGAAFFSFYYFALIGWVQGGFADPVPIFERMLSEHLCGVVPVKPPPAPKPRRKSR
jgi:AcrR family transcriptional regulator